MFNIKFFNFVKPENGKTEIKEVSCKELFEAATEFEIRKLCFDVCVNMIANAVSRCEFKTYENHKEIRKKEYWLWNFEPNVNQNATIFIHKLIWNLYHKNEALVLETKKRNDESGLVVADSWTPSEIFPQKQREYYGVTVENFTYKKTFKEEDVLYFKLNNKDIAEVLNKMNLAYEKLVESAAANYKWSKGQHWKVHVDSIAQGKEDFESSFANMIKEQLKPFFESFRSVLPEFDGFTYTNMSSDVKQDPEEIRGLIEDIFNDTAKSLLIPIVLVNGKVEATADANNRFLTYVVDPILDQFDSEINRKRFGFDEWEKGNYLHVDSSSIIHFDLFANAANIEKIVGSGAFSINAILKAAGQEPINEEWANQHYMTKNIGTVQELANQKGGKTE